MDRETIESGRSSADTGGYVPGKKWVKKLIEMAEMGSDSIYTPFTQSNNHNKESLTPNTPSLDIIPPE